MIRMLQQQNSTLKILLGTVIGAFIVLLVFSLVPGIYDWNNTGASAGVLVKVGDRPVLVQDVERQTDMQMRRNKIPEQLKTMFLPRVVEQVVTQNAVLDQANRMGLRVSDQELQEELHAGQMGQVLFPNGQFIGKDKYMDFVQGQFNLSVERFESLVKDDLLFQKVQAIVAGAAVVSDSEIKLAYDKQNLKVKFEYASFSAPELQKSINPTDSELRSFYDKNKASYTNTIPEKRKLKYVLLNPAKVIGDTTPTQQESQSYYDSHKQQFQVPERVKVAHILISPKPGKDGKPDDAAAKSKAEDLLKQIKAGGDFADLAKKNSDDPGSAKNGGELGFLTRGMTVAEFDKSAFSLNPGQISDLIHTNFGYHIIKSEAKEPAHAQSFDEVKQNIDTTLRQQKSTQATTKYVEQVQSEVKAQGLDKAAAKLGLDVLMTDYVSQNEAVPGIGPAPEFLQAAFQAAKGTPVVAHAPQGYAIVEAMDVKPPATPTFEEAKKQVDQQFKQQQSAELVQRKTQELADRAKAEHDLKKAAQETGATFKTTDFVGANDQVAGLGAMSGPAGVALTMDPGQVSAPTSSGEVAFVLQVTDRKLPAAEDFSKQKEQIRTAILGQKRSQNFVLFAEATRLRMEKDGKIKYNEGEKKRLGLGANPGPLQGQ